MKSSSKVSNIILSSLAAIATFAVLGAITIIILTATDSHVGPGVFGILIGIGLISFEIYKLVYSKLCNSRKRNEPNETDNDGNKDSENMLIPEEQGEVTVVELPAEKAALLSDVTPNDTINAPTRIIKPSILEYIKVAFLGVIAVCAIILVVQGALDKTPSVLDVYVQGGNIDADVSGSVSVDNTVDVNLEEVIGHTVGCHDSYKIDGKSYKAIDVFAR